LGGAVPSLLTTPVAAESPMPATAFSVQLPPRAAPLVERLCCESVKPPAASAVEPETDFGHRVVARAPSTVQQCVALASRLEEHRA
jgi:hypothetical protein